jgi:hypothetical protein
VVRIRPGSLGTWRGKRLKELKPVAVRVLTVEAAHAGELVIEAHRVPGVPQSARPGVDPGHQQAGMRLAGGPEVFLDAEVEFDAVAAEPAPAARGRIAAVR